MIAFVFNSILLGVGLAMDAFSVSIANGLNEPGMKRSRECLIAGVYAFFQCLMPIIGWFCVHELVRQFRAFEPFIPWIALLLLLWIGGKMLLEGIRDAKAGDPGAEPAASTEAAAETDSASAVKATTETETAGSDRTADAKVAADAETVAGTKPAADTKPAATPAPRLTAGTLLLQGIATSIDALSVGFAIAGYSAAAALAAALIIAAVTFLICMGGLTAGKKLGMKLAGKAGILGGCILIFIGIEIFVRGVFL